MLNTKANLKRKARSVSYSKP